MQSLTQQYRSSAISCTGDSSGLFLCSFVRRSLSDDLVSNAVSLLDLYYLAFPKDRRLIKCIVYGIYIIEFVQTILVTHDAFAIFGYGFGDLEALTDVHFNWLVVPIMGAASTSSIFRSFFATYREYSCFCRAVLLCIPNLRIVKVTDRPCIRHLCSLPCS